MNGDFFLTSFIGVTMIFATSMLMYEIFRIVWRFMPGLHVPVRLRLLMLLVPIFAAHIINIWLYAAVYFFVENFTAVGVIHGLGTTTHLDFQTFTDCLYFSSATYTALGFGDGVPTADLRMLTAAEALNGLVLMGWTISFTYIAMEGFLKDALKK